MPCAQKCPKVRSSVLPRKERSDLELERLPRRPPAASEGYSGGNSPTNDPHQRPVFLRFDGKRLRQTGSQRSSSPTQKAPTPEAIRNADRLREEEPESPLIRAGFRMGAARTGTSERPCGQQRNPAWEG